MDFSVKQYNDNINRLYFKFNARGHSYGGDLQRLFATILSHDILVTNEPACIECGVPDYLLNIGKANILVDYIKAKTFKEQFDRYRLGLSNLIIT